MTELLWFMAPRPLIDRPIKCFSNIAISELIDCQIELTAMRDARVLRGGRRSKTKLTALAPLRQSTFGILLRLLLITRIFTHTKKNNQTLWVTRLELALRVLFSESSVFWYKPTPTPPPPYYCFHSLCLEAYADFITGLKIHIQFECEGGGRGEELWRAVVFEETNDWMINRFRRGEERPPDAADAPRRAVGFSDLPLVSAALCVWKATVAITEDWQNLGKPREAVSRRKPTAFDILLLLSQRDAF